MTKIMFAAFVFVLTLGVGSGFSQREGDTRDRPSQAEREAATKDKESSGSNRESNSSNREPAAAAARPAAERIVKEAAKAAGKQGYEKLQPEMPDQKTYDRQLRESQERERQDRERQQREKENKDYNRRTGEDSCSRCK